MTLPLILASASPRRQELLAELGLPFTVCPSAIAEVLRPGLTPAHQAESLARQKAEAVAGQQSGPCLVLGADTLVCVASEILGKPTDAADADRMLTLLSGRWHEVVTGIALIRTGPAAKTVATSATTRVKFRPLTARQRQEYIQSGEPMDKAGAYAIQGLAGQFVDGVEGDYTNVVGLPVPLVRKLLQEEFNLPL